MHATKILTTVLITAIVQCAAARDFKVEAGQSIQVAACCGVRPRTRLRIGAWRIDVVADPIAEFVSPFRQIASDVAAVAMRRPGENPGVATSAGAEPLADAYFAARFCG
jgi:hypothetical protein